MTTWSFVPPSLRRSCKGHERPEPLFSARSLESMAIGAGGDQAAEAVSLGNADPELFRHGSEGRIGV